MKQDVACLSNQFPNPPMKPIHLDLVEEAQEVSASERLGSGWLGWSAAFTPLQRSLIQRVRYFEAIELRALKRHECRAP